MTSPHPPPWLPPVRQPPRVPVYVDTSKYIFTRYGAYPTFVEFAPGMRFVLAPSQRHEFYLAPGVYRASFYTSYFGIRVGRAEAVVDTRSGQPVYVGYAAPYTIWTSGRAGYPPLKRPGLAAIPIIIGIAFTVPLLFFLIAYLVQRG